MVKKNYLSSHLSHLIAGAILASIIVVLIVISGKLPGITKIVFGNIEVYYVVVLVFILVNIGILLDVRTSAQILLGYLLSNRGKKELVVEVMNFRREI